MQQRQNARKATATTCANCDQSLVSAENSKEKKPNRSYARTKRSNNSIIGPQWIGLVAFVIVWCVGTYQYIIHWQQEQLLLYDDHLKLQLGPLTKVWEDQVVVLQHEKDELERVASKHDIQKMHREKDTKKRDEEQADHMAKLQGQVDHLKENKEHMHTAIQHISRNVVLEKFGPGPHRVEMILAFDPAEPGEGDAHRIVLELAPLDDMPHANYWFLHQVSLNLWNGCSFHRNAGHVLQSGAAGNFMNAGNNTNKEQEFVTAGYSSILFQEYSPNFPHLPLTVGYAGRPGGPDFYISTMDNSVNHGPGGQGEYDDVGEADPCFAKVVEGEDAVWRMHGLSVKDGAYEGLVHNVAIVDMRLLK
eukprot:CAMPEP_0119004220 /NCGR_PEP_ID=MMETSP1176-20130426/1023_1 /TAXON_ID=265551 /ORGANISM="Synedropsis recta cf, Strain CCMP1620" /LENGTH=361 /DNA_ID=CAMNT_0006955905 /DNA_START=66 /DNA_END=1151 /DNA_ORIENTATION=+